MALYEGLTFGSLDLNNAAGPYSLEALDMTPPAKKPEWAQSADGDGQALVRTPLYENRKVTIQLRIEGQGTMDLALTAVGNLVDQIQEAEKQPDGTALVWTPANGTRSITFYVLTGAVTGVPISVTQQAGWFVNRPVITVELTCKPFGYGTEVAGSSVSSGSAPHAIVTIATVAGDVPAEGRLVLTETSGTYYRGFAEWGLEQRYYNAATPLIQLSTSMVAASGTLVTAAGAYSGSIFQATAPTGGSTLNICTTGNQGHVGTFRVRARVHSSGSASSIRFQWQDGSGVMISNPFVAVSPAVTWIDVDLGIITIAPAVAGAQKWLGQFNITSTVASQTVEVDFAFYIPVAEGYGKADDPNAYVCIPNKTLEFRSASTLVGDLTGSYYGAPYRYRGARFFVPPSGSAGRTTRIFARMPDNDIDAGGSWARVGDPFSVQPYWTPRYLVIPR